MRHLSKSVPPDILVNNAEAWTASYIASGGKTSPWSNKEIKSAIIRETGGKCAYCEARILDVSFGDIEHIYPKSKFPELVVDWNNLTLACSRCNLHKSSKYEHELEFLNPYVDYPEQHLVFLGPAVYYLTHRGMYTILELGLNEIERVEARMRAIDNVANLLARFKNAENQANRQMFETLIRKVCEEGEYTSAVSAYLKAVADTPARHSICP